MPLAMPTLDDYVEAFERARQEQENLALGLYLPPREDPLYRPVLRELVRIDLEFGWESNRPRALDDYRTDFPELFSDPESLQEVAFEEFRLRRQAGHSPDPQEYASRYGIRTDGWPGQPQPLDPALVSIQIEQAARSYQDHRHAADEDASINLDNWRMPSTGGEVAHLFRELHRADHHLAGQLADGLNHMPIPGGEVAGFHLVSELGRGAFGRVFLARQAALADRPVALKVAPDVGSESQALAQLQHTHIVPIYSVHRAGPLQAVCMPYCGSVTVADVVRDLQSRPGLPQRGTDLLRVLPQRNRSVAPTEQPGPAPAVRATLEKLDYPSAVLWLGARLAEGLDHAHVRGILHRDVKPANVLLTDEGLPMLLDFNIAEDVKHAGASVAMLGGTLPYMAPEHLAAFRGGNLPVDGRSDVYSLGIVLFELLTGRFPFFPVRMPADGAGGLERLLDRMLEERLGPVPCPRRYNPAITAGTAAIVRHCLEPDPARRYQSARELSEDVARHLANEPLVHAPEPSPGERLLKWWRRNPRLGFRLSVTGLVLVAMVASGLGTWVWWRGRLDQARQVRTEFHPAYRQAQFLLSTRPESGEQFDKGMEACRRALGLYGVFDEPDQWQDRSAIRALPPEEREAALAEIGELLYLLARTQAPEGEAVSQERLGEAIGNNRLAISCFPPDGVPPAIWALQASLAGRLDGKRFEYEARQALQKASTPILGVRDRYLAARQHTLASRYSQAIALLEPAVREKPDDYWALFMLGDCYAQRGRDSRAISCYTACIALEPNGHEAYHNRALAHLRTRMYGEANADLNQVIRLVPDRAEAYLDRALARRALKDYKGALADLDQALEHHIPPTRIYLLRSRIRRQAGDRAGADADLAEGLRRKPADELSWIARGVARMHRDRKGALADFDEALRLNPRSLKARQNKAHVLAELENDQPGARRVLEDTLKDYPDHVETLAGLAVVLARLGERDLAHRRIAAALEGDADGMIRYQAGCVHALTSRKVPADAERALVYLRQAINLGTGLEFLASDADLNPLRKNSSFQLMVEATRLLDRASKAR